MFADTHCHLDFPYLSAQLPFIQSGMDENKLGMIVIPSTGKGSWSRVESLSAKDERFFFALGLHPYVIEQHDIKDIAALEYEILSLKGGLAASLVAIGEIGLDFSKSDPEKQIVLFEAQLGIAEKHKLPVIIHTRLAHQQTLKSLKKFSLVGGVVHAFSGSFELLMNYVDLGLKIGVGPVITWATSSKTKKAIMRAPIKSLVLETDSPDMAVMGGDVGKGSPLDVVTVFSALQQIRTEDDIQLKLSLWENSCQLFSRAECN